MTTKHGLLAAATLAAVCLAGVAPGVAQERSQRERAEEFARQGMERLMQALDLLIQSIPQYELPVINENGDIIIRRRRDPAPTQPAPGPSDQGIDATNT